MRFGLGAVLGVMRRRGAVASAVLPALALVLLPAALARAQPERSLEDLRGRAARWVRAHPDLVPSVEVLVDDAVRRAALSGFEVPVDFTGEEAVGLHAEDLLTPLGAAVLQVELTRHARLEGPGTDALRPRLDAALERADAWVQEAWSAWADRRQPPAATGDRLRALRTRVEARIADALWDWAAAEGVALGQGAYDGFESEGEGPASFPALQADARAAARGAEGALPVEVTRSADGNALEYHLGRAPVVVRWMLRVDGPLQEAWFQVEQLRGAVDPQAGRGREADADFWRPALDAAEDALRHAAAELARPGYGAWVRRARMVSWRERVRDLVLARLWAQAEREGLGLWPVYAPAELELPPDAVRPTAALDALAARGLHVLLQPEHVRLIAVPIPAEYEELQEQVMVKPANFLREWVPPSYGRGVDGQPVLIEPGHWEEREVPAEYRTVTRRVAVRPAHAQIGTEVVPELQGVVPVGEGFGALLHAWFLERWTWEHRPGLRPPAPGAWDGDGSSPPAGWIDLLHHEGAVLGRRRAPWVEGYLVVVGERGSAGPALVRLGDATDAFAAPERPRR